MDKNMKFSVENESLIFCIYWDLIVGKVGFLEDKYSNRNTGILSRLGQFGKPQRNMWSHQGIIKFIWLDLFWIKWFLNV